MRDVVRETSSDVVMQSLAAAGHELLLQEAKIMKGHQQHFLCPAIIQSTATSADPGSDSLTLTVDNQINNQEMLSSVRSIIHPNSASGEKRRKRVVFLSFSFLTLDKCCDISHAVLDGQAMDESPHSCLSHSLRHFAFSVSFLF
jgi:hypothetical protein